jgi:hypothetical protein
MSVLRLFLLFGSLGCVETTDDEPMDTDSSEPADTDVPADTDGATIPADLPVLYVNEFMASNATGLMDEAGAYPDWMELYNPGSSAVELGGMYVTDDATEPLLHRIEAGVRIEANGFLVLFADNDVEEGPLHLDFNLAASGEAIGLYSTDETGNQIIDLVEFSMQQTDVSWARLEDGGEDWGPDDTPTPGEANN